MDLAVDMAVAGVGIIALFEEWLDPHLKSRRFVPVLSDWWQSFPALFLILFRPPPGTTATARIFGFHQNKIV
jgi:DNA-binding transcriptional LysR family regulator